MTPPVAGADHDALPPEDAEITVLSGNPSPAELAAIVTVVSAQLAEAAGTAADGELPQGRTRWDRARIGLRRPLSPEGGD